MIFDFEAPLWEWDARRTARWTFVSVPEDASAELLERAGAFARGFGSRRGEGTVGGTTGRTSIFPDGKRRAYSLPGKRAVRDAEGLTVAEISAPDGAFAGGGARTVHVLVPQAQLSAVLGALAGEGTVGVVPVPGA